MKEPKPPKTALKFFRWYCHPDFREEIEGDLIENFYNDLQNYQPETARWFFIKQVFFLFRPSIIKSTHHLINKKTTTMLLQNKRLISILAVAAGILLIPFIAMNFTNEVNWTFFDFLVASILLFGTGLAFEFILRKPKTIQYKIVFSVVLFLALFLVWAELAVGIFGTPLSGN